MNLVFDIETTGLPLRKGFNSYFPPENIIKYNPSRIVSIAWATFQPDSTQVTQHYYIIKPNDFQINNNSKATQVNGITKEIAETKGIPFSQMITFLETDVDNSNTLIAHNLQFDLHILLSELYRSNNTNLIQKIRTLKQYCTMKKSCPILKLPSASDKYYKNPKLIELYQSFYPNGQFQQHDALEDVRACAQCYFKLIKLPDYIKLSKSMSYLLRHGAKKVGLTIESDGYVSVDDLLTKLKPNYTLEDIQFVVNHDSKNRYNLKKISNNKYKISANQGHSIPLDDTSYLTTIQSPDEVDVCVHATQKDAWKLIQSTGYLSKMSRNHVHFSSTIKPKKRTGGLRTNAPILIYLNVPLYLQDGYTLFKSKNEVLLTPGDGDGHIPKKYFLKVVDTTN